MWKFISFVFVHSSRISRNKRMLKLDLNFTTVLHLANYLIQCLYFSGGWDCQSGDDFTNFILSNFTTLPEHHNDASCKPSASEVIESLLSQMPVLRRVVNVGEIVPWSDAFQRYERLKPNDRLWPLPDCLDLHQCFTVYNLCDGHEFKAVVSPNFTWDRQPWTLWSQEPSVSSCRYCLGIQRVFKSPSTGQLYIYI